VDGGGGPAPGITGIVKGTSGQLYGFWDNGDGTTGQYEITMSGTPSSVKIRDIPGSYLWYASNNADNSAIFLSMMQSVKKSTDNGATWTTVYSADAGACVRVLVADPVGGGVIVGTTNSKLLRVI
jgi:hypothetical protein